MTSTMSGCSTVIGRIFLPYQLTTNDETELLHRAADKPQIPSKRDPNIKKVKIK
jgi:hypothetical protein